MVIIASSSFESKAMEAAIGQDGDIEGVEVLLISNLVIVICAKVTYIDEDFTSVLQALVPLHCYIGIRCWDLSDG